MHTDQQSLLVARKRPVGRPKTEGRVYASLKQCERSTGVPLSVLKILRNMSPEAFPPGGRVKWDKLNPGLKELAAMVSGNGGRDSKEELEKLYLKKRIEQTEAKTELFRDKYLDKEEVIQWCEASYSQLSARLQQLFATIAPKLQGLTAAEVQSRLSREIPVVFKSLRELQRTVQTSSKK